MPDRLGSGRRHAGMEKRRGWAKGPPEGGLDRIQGGFVGRGPAADHADSSSPAKHFLCRKKQKAIGDARSPSSCRVLPGANSERQIVVFGVERLGEILERLSLPLGAAAPAAATLLARIERFRALALAGEQDQLARGDLGGIPGLAFSVLPRPILDAALDVDLVALLAVLLGDIRESGTLVVPEDDAVPLGLFLLLARSGSSTAGWWRRESVATREPFEVLRTSGSAPRFPIRMTLFRLRLTCTSRVLA